MFHGFRILLVGRSVVLTPSRLAAAAEGLPACENVFHCEHMILRDFTGKAMRLIVLSSASLLEVLVLLLCLLPCITSPCVFSDQVGQSFAAVRRWLLMQAEAQDCIDCICSPKVATATQHCTDKQKILAQANASCGA